MLPIPAIDIQSGKCVRLKMGNLDSAKIYYENPLEAAEFWIEKGTKRLHIVDLDGALEGSSINFSVILTFKIFSFSKKILESLHLLPSFEKQDICSRLFMLL